VEGDAGTSPLNPGDPRCTSSSARAGFPIRIWDTAVLAAASVLTPFSVSTPPSEGADDGGHAPHHYRRVCQRRRQMPDRGAQRGVDECPRRRTDKRTDAHLPQRNSERPERIGGERIRYAGDESLADDPHNPRRSISASMRSARFVPSSARALSRPARLPTRLATIAVPTVAPSVTKIPSTGPNRIPLPAARIAPGTNNAPRTADTTI
jgi:hypothetical protein